MLKKMKTLASEWQLNHEHRLKNDKNIRTITMCKKCYTFYYRHAWHFEMPAELKELNRNEDVAVRFKECPACIEQEEALYESEDDNFKSSDFAWGGGLGTV